MLCIKLLFQYFCFITVINICLTVKRTCSWKNCASYKPNILNVHMVSHSHQDLGWVKTIDQYYDLEVFNILTTVVEALWENPNRKFVQAEIAYFYRWWLSQSYENQEILKNLIKRGQFEFVGGGWSMNDEAVTNYEAIIDQMSLGLRTINDTVGECALPTVAWQIDPFGHSREIASIFTQMGFEALFLGRIDYRDKKTRIETKNLEFIWKTDPLLVTGSNIFTSVLYNLYQPPEGFCFDILCGNAIGPLNVHKKVPEFVKFIEEQSKVYRSNNILITMGGDFTYTNAHYYFKQIDFLINYITNHNVTLSDGSPINIFYSTPSCYIESVMKYVSDTAWSVKTDDFFPYANEKHSYWTGFYTSRPSFKRYIRESYNLLHSTNQLSTIVGHDNPNTTDLVYLNQIVGVMQHHDAITGTSKHYVIDDYVNMLHKARRMVMSENAKRLGLIIGLQQQDIDLFRMNYCELENITQCSLSVHSKNFLMAVYNPLSRPVNFHVHVPVMSPNCEVFSKDGEIQSQITPNEDPFANSTYMYNLVFLAENVSALGIRFYYIKKSFNIKNNLATKTNRRVFGTNELRLELNKDGYLSQIIKPDLRLPITQTLECYNSHPGDKILQSKPSGAYIFRPLNKYIFFKPKTSFYTGNIYDEIRQEFSDWAMQIIRIYKDNKKYIEFNWIVGPININGTTGREVISRFKTTLVSNSYFTTDTNGKGFIKRQRSHKVVDEPIASYYFPITNSITITDDRRNLYFTVFTDRAQGGSSIRNGEVELMVHRRLTTDDKLGVDEPLNERQPFMGAISKGQHIIDFGYNQNSNTESISIELNLKPLQFIAARNVNNKEIIKNLLSFKYSGLRKSLPSSIHLLTLEPWNLYEDLVLLRFEHINDVSEGAAIDLNELFTDFDIIDSKETDISGLIFIENENYNQSKIDKQTAKKIEIYFKPGEIRTFLITVKYNINAKFQNKLAVYHKSN